MSDSHGKSDARVDNLTDLIEGLRNPASYAHSAELIEILQTHISWVVLAGEYAYKIKKPVDFGFADFSTLQRRHFFCQEEVRLNSRLAPSLYLGVVPITGDVKAPRVDGPGAPIEWSVQMRRFQQDQLLLHVIENGRLTPRHVDSLAREIVDFHSRIPVAALESRIGTPEVVAEQIFAIFDHLDVAGIDRNRIDRLFGWCNCELDKRHAQLLSRKVSGHIRECHGDMHLGNMVLIDGAIMIFDCIDFNEDLRWIDVLSEIAFCAMDLAARGRVDLAHRFRNRCLEWSGDYSDLVLFRLYSVYRALVRAKVALLRIQAGHCPDDERDAFIHEFQRLFALAEGYTNRSSRFLAITHGVSGSGKTFGSEQILEHSGAIRIRSDVERKRLGGVPPLESSRSDLISDLYSSTLTDQTYKTLRQQAAAILESGFPVVVDATFLQTPHCGQFQLLAETMRVPFVILDFVTTESTCRERIRARAKTSDDPSEATEIVLSDQLRVHDALSEEERPSMVTIDARDAGSVERACFEVDHRRRANV